MTHEAHDAQGLRRPAAPREPPPGDPRHCPSSLGLGDLGGVRQATRARLGDPGQATRARLGDPGQAMRARLGDPGQAMRASFSGGSLQRLLFTACLYSVFSLHRVVYSAFFLHRVVYSVFSLHRVAYSVFSLQRVSTASSLYTVLPPTASSPYSASLQRLLFTPCLLQRIIHDGGRRGGGQRRCLGWGRGAGTGEETRMRRCLRRTSRPSPTSTSPSSPSRCLCVYVCARVRACVHGSDTASLGRDGGDTST